MASVSKKNGTFSLKAYLGDAKTLLAFNLAKADAGTSPASPSAASRKA